VKARAIVRLVAIPAVWSAGLGMWSPFSGAHNVLSAQIPRPTTKFQVDPSWPKPLPNDLILGPGSGVCVDPADHVMIVQRTAEIKETNPEQSVEYGPSVVEYDAEGNVLKTWGDPKLIPAAVHSCAFSRDGNVWIDGQDDAVVQKYSRDGKLLMQIGTKLKFDTSDGTIKGKALDASHELLNRPTAFAEDPSNGDLYVADGNGNHRIAVFDSSGKFLRQFGRLATKAEAEAGAEGVFKKSIHCLVLSNDGLVYACDREGRRIQVFDKMGNYQKSMYVPRKRADIPGRPEVTTLVLSRDKVQKYMYVGTPEGRIWTVDRESGQVVSAFGRHGTMAGEFYVHDLAINSKGDLFIAEEGGRRMQRFKAVGKD
jgi:hypothetical protein